MESALHPLKLLLYCYYLDEKDHYFVTEAANRVLNWTIPSFIGPWMYVHIFLISNNSISIWRKRMLKKLKYVTPLVSLNLMYLIYYYKNPEVDELFKKYPYDMDLGSRKRLNAKNLSYKY
jgi:hypothetical protein